MNKKKSIAPCSLIDSNRHLLAMFLNGPYSNIFVRNI